MRSKVISLLQQSTIILLAFAGVMVGGMLLNPASFTKFFFYPTVVPVESRSLSYYWDVGSYASLAITPLCSAFYPLWPALIRLLFAPGNQDEAARYLLITATFLFILSIPLLVFVLRRITRDRFLTLWIALLFTLSPMAIFRVIGYTESIFSVMGLCLVALLCQIPPRRFAGYSFAALFGLSTFMSLTRPALIQIIGSSVASLGCLFLLDSFSQKPLNGIKIPRLEYLQRFYQRHQFWVHATVVLTAGALVGYSIYGLSCWQENGNFFSPFDQQKYWGKQLRFSPLLLFSSRSPYTDLLALYFPPFLTALAVYQVLRTIVRSNPEKIPAWWMDLKLIPTRWSTLLAFYPPLWIAVHTVYNWRSRTSHPSQKLPAPVPDAAQSDPPAFPHWSNCYGFWFSLCFALSHCVIVFFSQGRLFSLGRFIFGQPFAFLALAFLATGFSRKDQRFVLPTLCGISALFLLDQWIRYGSHRWMG
jgi:hypothetical protein